jgi:hypothetical protein
MMRTIFLGVLTKSGTIAMRETWMQSPRGPARARRGRMLKILRTRQTLRRMSPGRAKLVMSQRPRALCGRIVANPPRDSLEATGGIVETDPQIIVALDRIKISDFGKSGAQHRAAQRRSSQRKFHFDLNGLTKNFGSVCRGKF